MLNSLRKTYYNILPDVEFASAKSFYWSPKNRIIHVDESSLATQAGHWALLHEVGHAILQHTGYKSDFELLALEVDAWKEAKKIAKEQGITIDEDHIQDCLDTYRDWLYARSTCPTCKLNSLQTSASTYKCANCHTEWRVSKSRFCRPYRMKAGHQKSATL